MGRATFDAERFYKVLEAIRLEREMSWKQVAKEAGVSASTLTRLAQGKRPDMDSFTALVRWSGRKADDFIRQPEGGSPPTDPIGQIAVYLRADSQLDAKTADAIERVLRATYALVKEEDADDRVPPRVQNGG